jgi:taurine dioxygenase
MAQAIHDKIAINETGYARFQATPVTGTFGATVSGIQVADAIDDDELFAEIHAAWLKYQVLFFRDQELPPEKHLALGKRFGEIQKQGYAPSLEGHEGVWVQEYPDLYEGVVADINWHSDSSFRETPTRGSLLYAIDVPVAGGDTVWADMCAAYHDLAPAWKTFLEGLSCVHDNLAKNWLRVLEKSGGKALDDVRKFLPPSEHPVICTHPETNRKFLFVSELMSREISGMNERESRAVLEFLFAHQTRPEYQARLHWEPKSLTLWDNFSTIHRGIFDFGQSHRLMHRVSFNTPWKQ